MICEPCGGVGETFMTERYSGLCETCQKQVEAEQPQPKRRQFSGEEEG